jgi:hypothetical protein
MRAEFAAWFDTAIWFWVAAAAIWWRVCGVTLGVPSDLLHRAGRDEADAALFDRLARRNAALAAASWARNGAWIVAAAAFLICFAGGVAVLRLSPSAAAAFCLIAPLSAHSIAAGRAAQRIAAGAPEPAALLERFRALRLQAVLAAALSFALAATLRVAALPL